MERFELAPDRAPTRSPAAWAATSGDDREPQLASPTSERRGQTAPFDGFLAIGAVTGSAAALVVSDLVGLTGTAGTVAVLAGLDLGVLVGAGVGGWLARRARRHDDTVGRV